MEALEQEMEKLKGEHELQVSQIKESLREELEKYERDLRTWDESIELMWVKRGVKPKDNPSSEMARAEALSSGGGSLEPEGLGESQWGNRLKLPTLPKFTGEDRDDIDSLHRWVAKLNKHAELQR